MKRFVIATVLALSVFSVCAELRAATTYDGVGDDWSNNARWSGGAFPTGAFNQRLNFTVNGTNVTYGAAQGTTDIAGTVAADARAFVIGNTNPNVAATSILNITGGTLRAAPTANAAGSGSSLVGANGLNSNGTLNVSGTGTLDLTTAATASPRILSLGLGGTANTGISGTVNLSDTGLIKVSEFRFAETAPNVGGSITGVLNLNGGTLETGTLQEVTGTANALVTSTVNLNGGLLRLTAASGIDDSLNTVNVQNGGANIEVTTGVTAASGKNLLGVGSGGLTKTGTGTLTLTDNSTYTGATAISAGTLSAGKIVVSGGDSSLGNAASAVTLGSAGTLGTLSYTGSTATYTRGFTIGGAGGGGLNVTTSGQILTIDTAGVTGSGLFTVGGAGRTVINSTVTHTGGVTKGPFVTATTALTLANGSNSYDGVTTVQHGAIVVTANGALGSTAAGTTVASGASLALSGGIDYSNLETVTGSGPGSGVVTGVLAALQRGFIQSASGNNTFRGNIVIDAGGTTRIGAQDGAQLTLTGTITQASGNILFRAGNLAGDFVTLSNAGNSFGADSTVFAGAAAGVHTGVRLGVTNGLPTNRTISGLATAGAGTAFDLNGFNQSLNGLITGGAGLNIINLDTINTSLLTLNPTADQVTTNTLIRGGGGLGTINVEKVGTFSQTLSGDSDYTGTTTITAGTLLANNTSGSATGSGGVIINGGKFGGTGSISGGITLNSGGTLSPGASIESLGAGNNIWNGGGLFDFEFSTDGGTGTAGVEWDLLTVTGSLDLTGASSGNPVVFNLFTMSNATTPGLLGTWNPNVSHTWAGFATTTTGVTAFAANKFSIDTTNFLNTINGTFSVVQNGNNLDLQYIPVPEPSSLAMLLFGVIGLWFFRKAT